MTGLLRRSELALPASNDYMFAKAPQRRRPGLPRSRGRRPPAFKEESAEKAIAALNELDWGCTARAVRINGLDTHGPTTTSSRSSPAPATTSTPSWSPRPSAGDVWWVDVLLTQLEAKLNLRRIRLEVLIEEVEGLANAEAIAAASPRIDALIFGVGDFSLSQGARVDTNFVPLGDYPGDFWHYARNKIMVAARIAGIDAIDAPYPDYQDLAGLHATLVGPR